MKHAVALFLSLALSVVGGNEGLLGYYGWVQSQGSQSEEFRAYFEASHKTRQARYTKFLTAFFDAFLKRNQPLMDSIVASNSGIAQGLVSDYLDLAEAMAAHTNLQDEAFDWSGGRFLDFSALATVVVTVAMCHSMESGSTVPDYISRKLARIIAKAMDAATRSQRDGRDYVSVDKYAGVARLARLSQAPELEALAYSRLSEIYESRGDSRAAAQYREKARLIRRAMPGR